MIARVWRGRVRPDRADDYFQLMLDIAVPDYQSCPGNRGVWCLRRDDPEGVHVVMLTTWDDIDSIHRFAGEPIDKAKYYDFDPEYLLSLPERVEHYEVVAGFMT